MAIQSSGNPISTSDINVEIGKSATALISLNDTDVRRLMELPSGEISMGNAYGKSYRFTQTISANTSNLNLRAYAIANGWDQQANIIITIDPNIIIYSTSTSSSALVIDGSWPKGVTLINKGLIVGKGGNGGPNLSTTNGSPGGAGGTAIFSNTNVTINNTGTIAGGGGGGGGAGRYSLGFGLSSTTGGYGGGGGAGKDVGTGGAGGSKIFGTGYQPSGQDGTLYTGGLSGTGAVNGEGRGGNLGQPGIKGIDIYLNVPLGPPIKVASGGAGGAAGLAVSGNSYVTWAATGTILGSRV